MTMEFFDKDGSLLENITSGDPVEFTIENSVGGLKIIEVKKL
jgi:Cu/Ag efflux protein CusF